MLYTVSFYLLGVGSPRATSRSYGDVYEGPSMVRVLLVSPSKPRFDVLSRRLPTRAGVERTTITGGTTELCIYIMSDLRYHRPSPPMKYSRTHSSASPPAELNYYQVMDKTNM